MKTATLLHPRIASAVRSLFILILLAAASVGGALQAQVPGIISYQGRITVSSTPFNGSGQFKFALVNATGSTSYWSNDNTSVAGSEPTAAVTLSVASGLYSVLLGANMTAVPSDVFDHADVRLRVWFSDGVNGFQLLTPDQRIASVGYAMRAETATSALSAGMALTVVNGAVTTNTIEDGAVNNSKLLDASVTTTKLVGSAVTQAKMANDSVGTAQIINAEVMADDLAANAVTSAKIADGAVTTAKIPDGSITQAKLGFAIGGGSADGAVPSGAQEYTTAGSHTFTVPAGVTKIMVEVWGAGAGFSGESVGEASSGAYSRKTFTVTPGSQWTVVVGAGGGLVETGPTPNGGNSSFTSVSTPSITLVSQGGKGGVETGLPTPALPDAGANIGRKGPFGGEVVTGSMSPPMVSVYDEDIMAMVHRQHSAAAEFAFAMPPTYPALPGYVLIQW